jgi:hypothetical protein
LQLPLRRKACRGFFRCPKNSTTSAGFEPANDNGHTERAQTLTLSLIAMNCSVHSFLFNVYCRHCYSSSLVHRHAQDYCRDKETAFVALYGQTANTRTYCYIQGW